ncbi:MAG: hypothetical protein KDA28_03960, partial [Phycisphaerales bacterium]|nr:hypothetical protein [Phycisphaerales bacterium]
ACATPLMLVLLQRPRCRSMHVTIQKEVADRLLASPSTPAYGSISVVAQVASDVRRVATLPPECFWPRPEVTSAMVALRARETDVDLRGLAAFCQDLFSKRRKQLGSVLGRDVAWPEGIDPTDRAERLDVASIVALFQAI